MSFGSDFDMDVLYTLKKGWNLRICVQIEQTSCWNVSLRCRGIHLIVTIKREYFSLFNSHQNKSLQTGIMPSQLKEAIVKPTLKKPHLDIQDLNNYRPVSNLPFLSKVIERVVAAQLTEYMTKNSLTEPLQSAYRQHHSTETALVHVLNDILLSLDKKKSVFLILLDLSAAFDTVDHKLLIDRISRRLGIGGVVRDWIESYIAGRTQ